MNISNDNIIFKNFSYYFIFIPILIFLVGLKDNSIWLDYYVYVDYFNQASASSFNEIIFSLKDPFFLIINKFFSGFGFNVFVFFCAASTLYLKFSAFTKSTHNIIALLFLYCSLYLFLHDYIQIRIALALALALYAIYSVRSSIIKYIFLFSSVLVHLSIFPLVITYLFSIKKITKLSIFLYVIFNLCFIYYIKIFGGERVESYIDSDVYNYFNFFALLPMLQLFFLIYVSLKFKSKVFSFEYFSTLMGVVLYYSLYQLPAVSVRFFEMFSIIFIIYLSNLYKRDYFFLIIYFSYLFVCFYNLLIKPGAILNQKFIFFLNFF